MTTPHPYFFRCWQATTTPQQHAKQLIEVAWLLMAEGYPIIEDLEGAVDNLPLLQSLHLIYADYITEIDQHYCTTALSATHRLAHAVEHGISGMAELDQQTFIERTGLDGLANNALSPATIVNHWAQIVSQYPLEIIDPLIAINQVKVIRILRTWSKLSDALGIDQAFLKKIMQDI
ncbi:DUF6031 family protein [Erwinia mallotivora]|uniref:DUF6031 family protein n=1 Tax=Erwinia mallotivora TaxID=69222 RepID=UPI0035E54780